MFETSFLWKEKGSPINDLFVLSSDEVLLLWGDDTQRILLARYWFRIYDVCTLVHVHRSLR